ncbi:hypothetical protein [Rhodanobacter lindaniclasticus]
MTFANATNVAGSGAITNLGSTAFNLTGTTAGNAGGIGYSGFSSADARRSPARLASTTSASSAKA